VVAFDLGTCDGKLMYQAVEWFFPQHGQSFRPGQYENVCTGHYVPRPDPGPRPVETTRPVENDMIVALMPLLRHESHNHVAVPSRRPASTPDARGGRGIWGE
jgi:hypothetical protein